MMASLALYLKWRPQRFEDVVGQEHVTQTLKNALRGERIAHAYLFTGPRGTGKTTMARLLAKAVNCLDQDVTQRPCNRCRMCTAINEGRLLDLIEMDAASHTGVDNVREAIRDKVGFRPSQARYKVYVIDEVHMLSTSAFNALLKTLEEPPEHVIFVLATTEPHRILPTIVSRCQRFDFHRIPLSALVARLRYIADQEEIQIEERALTSIARSATGSARDAISLLDQLAAYGDTVITVERLRAVLGLSDVELVHQLASCLAARDIGRGLDVINRTVEQGADLRQFAQQVLDYLRSVLLARVGGNVVDTDVDGQMPAELDSLARRLSVHDLLRAIKLFNQAQMDLRGSDHGQLALELAFVEAALEEAAPTAAPAAQAPTPAKVLAAERETVSTTPTASRAKGAGPTGSVPGVSGIQVLREQRPSVPATDADASPPAASPPPAAPPKVPTRMASDIKPSVQSASQAEPAASVSADYVRRMMDDISRHLRDDRPHGPDADGFFRTVFHIGEVVVLDGNRVFLALPQKVYSKVTNGITQAVERAVRAVLDTPCSVQFVDRSRLAEIKAVPPGPPTGVQVQVNGAEEVESASDSLLVSDEMDSYEDAVSDPVVQDLVKRGGQVTDVEVLPQD
jgi:DNA polymerase-3 subunit gamma/tau